MMLLRGAALLMLVALVAAAPMTTSPVADAAMRGDLDLVRSFLSEGGDVNTAQGDGMTALHWAAVGGDVKLAEMLLYAGANVRATTRIGAYTPLFLAAKTGRAEMVAVLLEASGDANAVTSTGALAFRAPNIMPMALPRPGATWRLTTAGLPLACA